MGHRIYSSLWLTLVSAVVVGCSAPDEPVVEPTVLVAPAAPEADSPPPTPASANEPTVAETPPVNNIAQFSPPFPDRLELFEPLQRAHGTVQRDEAGETVELKGFINVDQQKVLLAIDGVIAPIPEGGEKYGVQVIAIEPPSVVFQRGRNRRKLTLE